MGWTTGVRFPAGPVKGFFPLSHRVQTGFGAHPSSYNGYVGSLPQGNAAGVWILQLTFT